MSLNPRLVSERIMGHARFIEFDVQSIPKGAPRPRRAMYGKGVYVPETAKPFEDGIMIAALAVRPPAPIEGPVHLTVNFRLARPKLHFLRNKLRPTAPLWAMKKPDMDNALKVLMDTLTGIGFWSDDAQVVSISAHKVFVGESEFPGCWVRVEWGDPT